jgi:hypothetical protein
VEKEERADLEASDVAGAALFNLVLLSGDVRDDEGETGVVSKERGCVQIEVAVEMTLSHASRKSLSIFYSDRGRFA